MISLQRTEREDLSFIIKAEADPHTRRFILPWRFSDHLAALSLSDIAHFTAWDGSEAVGFAILAGLDSPHQSIEFKRLVVTEPGRGFGFAVIQVVQQLTFAEYGAERLWLDVMASNARARALYKRAGFVEEGCLRECLQTDDGRRESLIIMGQLARELGR